MTPEEHRVYARQYRAEGYGRNCDARYRERWRDKINEKQRLRKREKRRRDALCPNKGL